MNTEQIDFLFVPNEVLELALHMDDLFKEGGAFQLILKRIMESMLQEEMFDHLGHKPRDFKYTSTSNSRIGNQDLF